MIKINKTEMKSKIENLAQDLGLTNKEIAEKLNEEFTLEGRNKLSTGDVAKLKAQLGLKGLKPKKRAAFELIDDENEPVELEVKDEEVIDEVIIDEVVDYGTSGSF